MAPRDTFFMSWATFLANIILTLSKSCLVNIILTLSKVLGHLSRFPFLIPNRYRVHTFIVSQGHEMKLTVSLWKKQDNLSEYDWNSLLSKAIIRVGKNESSSLD